VFIGHYGAALAGKRIAPRVSLGTLFLGAQLPDLIWPILLLLGVERVRIEPGLIAASALDFQHYPYTHSLLGTVVQGVVLGLVYLALRGNRRGALVLSIAPLSHWVLDLIVHRPDLPLIPGLSQFVGFGLWNSLPGTLVVEFGLYAAGLWAYLRGTSARDRIGGYALWALVILLAVFYLASVLGPPPTNERAIAWAGLLGGWVIVLCGYWADAHRQMKAGAVR